MNFEKWISENYPKELWKDNGKFKIVDFVKNTKKRGENFAIVTRLLLGNKKILSSKS